MAKEPVAGRVKTRLARDIGVMAATGFFRSNLAVTAARLSRDTRWTTVLAVTPDRALSSPMLPRAATRIPQGSGDLGARLEKLCKVVPAGPLVVIGADIPGIRASHIASAFQSLTNSDVVFGPSGDGGYWLVGLGRRARLRARFRRIRWSTAFALSDTRGELAAGKHAEVAALDDVDDGDDYAAAYRRIGRMIV